MYEARFTTKQIYDNYAKSVSKPKSKPAKSRSLGGFEPDPAQRTSTKKSTPTVQTRDRRRDRRGSTYDEVPQVLTQGIVKRPAAKPVKEKGYEKVIRVFNNAMERFGVFDKPTSTYDTVKPQNVYKSSFFSVPKVTTITLPDMMPTTSSLYRPLPSGPDTRNFGTNIGADPSPEKPDSAKLDIFDILNTKEKVMRGSVPGLMSPPTMDQTKPETPGFTMEDAVNRAILATTKEYVIKPGDNLTKIAKRYNTTVKDLVQINKIENKNRIYAGESLRVPKDSVKDIKEAVLRVSTSGDEDPDKQFYQSGVSLDQRIFEPERDYLDNIPRSRELMLNTGNPDYNFMANNSKFTDALKATEADDYDTIFGNAEKRRTPFKGTKVSDMTLDEVLEFTKLNGKFHNHNKKKGYNTTAVGKYQIVGSTLRDLNSRGVLKKLGITDDTKFDEKTQDDIAAYIAVHRIKDRATGRVGGDLAPRGSARKEMRNAWEGFKKLSNDELDEIIDEIAEEIGVDIVDTVGTSIRPKAKPLGKS